jgi:hypothetical protein
MNTGSPNRFSGSTSGSSSRRDHLVVELAVYPALDDALDVGESQTISAIVERTAADLDSRRLRLWAVRVLADAVVLQQPVAVSRTQFSLVTEYMHSLVMLSGGLDSAVLAAQEAQTYVVHPVYVAGGLAWEEGEQRIIRQLLAGPPFDHRAQQGSASSPRLEFSMRDVYPETHWALTGTPPAYDTPDEDVYLHRPQHRAVVEGRRLRGQPQDLAHRRRAARREPISRRHARVSSRR